MMGLTRVGNVKTRELPVRSMSISTCTNVTQLAFRPNSVERWPPSILVTTTTWVEIPPAGRNKNWSKCCPAQVMSKTSWFPWSVVPTVRYVIAERSISRAVTPCNSRSPGWPTSRSELPTPTPFNQTHPVG